MLIVPRVPQLQTSSVGWHGSRKRRDFTLSSMAVTGSAYHFRQNHHRSSQLLPGILCQLHCKYRPSDSSNAAGCQFVAAGGAKEARLASEDEFSSRFPECEIGAMPPFGNLFGLAVFVDPALEKDEYIYFNAGNHVQTVRLKYQDFARLVKPQTARLVEEKKIAA